MTHLRILDVDNLTDMYDGSICAEDGELRLLLGAMCVVLTHHLKPLKKLCNDTLRNTIFLTELKSHSMFWIVCPVE